MWVITKLKQISVFSFEISKALMNFKPTETWKYLKCLTIV